MSPYDLQHPPDDYLRDPHGPTFRCYRDELRGPNGRICLVGFDAEHGAEGMLATEITWKDWRAVDVNERHPILAELSYASAQKLMDSLWNCGLRPTEGAGSAGAMAAVQRHLADMRTLVAAKMNLKEWGKP